MIQFHSENNFQFTSLEQSKQWLLDAISHLGFTPGPINFIFCDDDYLLELNEQYLAHDTLTDIISFDYTNNHTISGDIFISTERVSENAQIFSTSFKQELHRVLIHGILHFVGFNDKNEVERKEMRKQEDYYLSLLEF